MPKGKRKNLNKSVQVETTEELDGLNTSMQNPTVQSPLESDGTQPQEEPQQEKELVEDVNFPAEEELAEDFNFKIESADSSNQVVSNNNAEMTQDEIQPQEEPQQEKEPVEGVDYPTEEEGYAGDHNDENTGDVNEGGAEITIPVTEEPLTTSQIEELNRPKGVRVLGEDENPYEENSQEEPQQEDHDLAQSMADFEPKTTIESPTLNDRKRVNRSMSNPDSPFESNEDNIEKNEEAPDNNENNEIQNDINSIREPNMVQRTDTLHFPVSNEQPQEDSLDISESADEIHIPEQDPVFRPENFQRQSNQETVGITSNEVPETNPTNQQQEIPSIPATPETPTQQNTGSTRLQVAEMPPLPKEVQDAQKEQADLEASYRTIDPNTNQPHKLTDDELTLLADSQQQVNDILKKSQESLPTGSPLYEQLTNQRTAGQAKLRAFKAAKGKSLDFAQIMGNAEQYQEEREARRRSIDGNTQRQTAPTQQNAPNAPSDPYFVDVQKARTEVLKIGKELHSVDPQTNLLRKVNADDINRLLNAQRKLAEISTKALQEQKQRGVENSSLQAINRIALDEIKSLENAPMDGSHNLNEALAIGKQRSLEKQAATLQQNPMPSGSNPVMDEVQKALRARNSFFAAFSKPNPVSGDYPKLSGADLKDLAEMEQRLSDATIAAMKDRANRNLPPDPNLQMLDRVTGENLAAMKQVPKDGSATLRDVMLAARSHKVNVNPAAIQKLNGLPQPIVPMQLRGANGAQVPGVVVLGNPMQFANQNAMGQMARMYGCGNLVGQSYPVMLQTPGGQPVPGTFMRYMPGTDLAHPMYNDPYFLSNPGMYTNTPALRSVANLNALDYMCGTNGRGPTDMTYSFNGNGTFNGVCGVWNNNAFATNPVMGADSVPAIGSNMANAMMNTPPDFAAAQMYNSGMNPDQVQATLARIQQLLTMIVGGMLPVVPNAQWRNMNLNNLAAQTPQNATSNAFNSLQYVSNAQYPYMQQYALQQKYGPQQQQRPMYPGFTPQQGGAGMQGQAPQTEYDTMLAKIHAFNKGLKKMSLLTDSQEYKNVRQYSEYMEKELTRMVKNPTLDGGMQGEMFKKSQVNQMMENLSNLTDAYLDRRGNHTKAQPTSRSENRDMWMRMMNSYARSNSTERDKDAGQIFRDQLDTDDVRINMAKTRKNSYRAMDPEEVGKLIKRTVKVSDWLADMHPKMYATTHNGAQDLLTGYLNKVKDFKPAQIGLNKKDVKTIQEIGVKAPAKQQTVERTRAIENETPVQIQRYEAPGVKRQIPSVIV